MNGRYVSSDPLGQSGGLNPFEFSRSNPVRYVDPVGLVTWSGAVASGALVPGIGGGGYYFWLTSECRNGVQFSVEILCAALLVGKGAKLAGTTSPASLDDGMSDLAESNAEVFSGSDGGVGAFGVGSMGFAGYPVRGRGFVKGGFGLTAGGMMIGEAFGAGLEGQVGFDASIAVGPGICLVVRGPIKSACGTCPVDGSR